LESQHGTAKTAELREKIAKINSTVDSVIHAAAQDYNISEDGDLVKVTNRAYLHSRYYKPENDQGIWNAYRGIRVDGPTTKELSQHLPFQCVLCHHRVILNYDSHLENLNAWYEHVYGDLRPWFCTFEDCKTPVYSYQLRHSWLQHELEAHRPGYPKVLNDGTADDPCCLCQEKFATLRELRDHLGEHLEELACWTLAQHLEKLANRASASKVSNDEIEESDSSTDTEESGDSEYAVR
jgi:hypothetical protein